MAQLEIRLLGEFHLVHDKENFTPAFTPRLQALLAFILLKGASPISRDRTAFQFWPDVAETKARNNLRQLLYRLRKVLPEAERFLHVRSSTIQWRTEASSFVDVFQFKDKLSTATTIAQLEEALEFYGGTLLPGNYDEWILRERERLHQRYLMGHERLATMLEQQGDYEAAAQQLRKLLMLEPIRESGYLRLMRVFARLHDGAAVDRVYQELVTLLNSELGVGPSPALKKNHEKLMRVATGMKRRVQIPAQPTPFVGRESELLSISEYLQDEHCRLLTLVGPGGVGKTRLAMEAARNAAVDYLDGAIFVPLAGLTSAIQLDATLATRLGLQLVKEQPLRQQLVKYLSDKELLLVLDNYEHLLPDTSLLQRILSSSPNVQCLVTSRTRLRLRWEWLIDVAGLPVPESDEGKRREVDAIRLLRYHLRRLGVKIAPQRDDDAVLVRIARLTGGIPLALELAAAATRASSPAQLARSLADSADTLALPYRDTDPRHWSMRATFDHSWDLLAPREQDVLARLAVLRGGFDPSAAESMANTNEALLRGLVEKSLLRSEDGGRYVWHELLRQYAEEKLRDIPGARQEALADQLRYYAGAVKGAKGQDSANRRLVQLISMEIDNIRRAWQTAVREVNYDALNELVVGLGMYYQIQTLHEEGARMFHEAVSALREAVAAPNGSSGKQQRVLGHLLAWLAWMESESSHRFDLANEAVYLLRPLNAPLELGTALMSRGNALRMLESPGEAVPDFEEAIRLFRLVEEPFHLSGVINLLALAQGDLGDFTAAEHRLKEFLALARDGGIDYVIAIALGNLAWNARRRGAYAEAEAWIAERLELNRRLGNELSTANALHTAGVIAYEQGRFAEAEAQLLQAKETPNLRREAPRIWQDVMSGLTRVYLQLGEREKARRHLIDGLESLRDEQYRGRSIDLLLALAQWANLERPLVALELLALADKLAGADMRQDVRREWEQISSKMSPSALQEARSRGEARKLKQTIEQFLSEMRQH